MNRELREALLRVRWWILHLNRRQIRRWLFQVTRPASYPYITGDGFRRLAHHVYDETNRRIPIGKIRDGDVIFVCTDYLWEFFQRVAPEITARYKLITHNSIIPVDEQLVSMMPKGVITWFAKNNTFRHDRVVPIPLGLENLSKYNVGIPSDYSPFRQYDGPRRARILGGFTIGTNPDERQPADDVAAAAGCVDRLPDRLSQRDYLRALVSHKFVLSPPGSGLDANRTWEAMYLGVVPIVKDSVATRFFAELGLPLWVLRSWDELLSVGPDYLEAKYEQLKEGFASTALYMSFWRGLIRSSNTPMINTVPRQNAPTAVSPTVDGKALKVTPARSAEGQRRSEDLRA